MKILMTSIVDLKKSQHNRPHQFVKYLSEKHEITVVSISDNWKDEQFNSKDYNKDFQRIFDKIDYHFLTEKDVSPVIQEVFYNKKLKQLCRDDYDIHINYNSLVSGNYVSKKLPTIFDIADDLGAMIRNSPQIPKFLRNLGGRVGDFYIRKNISNSEKVTLTTKGLGKSCNVPKTKQEIIPNGVNIKDFSKISNAKAKLGFENFIIGYVGVLREWVDLKPVFRSLRNLNDEIMFVIVGKEGYLKENKQLAKDMGVSDKVIFTGGIKYSEVPKYISAMDVCLIPFKSNEISDGALPLKLFEYMACSKPVISTHIPGVKDAAGSKVLYANSSKDYTKHINTLFKNESKGKEMGDKGRTLVEKNYDWKRIIKKLDSVIRDVGEK